MKKLILIGFLALFSQNLFSVYDNNFVDLSRLEHLDYKITLMWNFCNRVNNIFLTSYSDNKPSEGDISSFDVRFLKNDKMIFANTKILKDDSQDTLLYKLEQKNDEFASLLETEKADENFDKLKIKYNEIYSIISLLMDK